MRRGLSVCGGPSGSAARPCTGVFNGSVAPPGYGLTCPQDSTIGYYPGMRCNKVLTLSTNAYSNIPITFHVHNPTTLLVLYRLYIQGSHFRATPLRRAIHLQLTYFPSGMPVTVAPATPRPISCPPNPNPDTRQTTVKALCRGSARASLCPRPDPTLCDSALSQFASQPPEPLQRYTLARECGGASHSTTVCFAMHDHRLTLQLHDNRLTCCESSGWLSSTD